MTPEEREALLRKYETKPEEVSAEVWKRGEEAQRYLQEKIERGEVLKSWSKENFPLGLDENMNPFPLTGPDQDQARDQDQAETDTEMRELAEQRRRDAED